MAWIIMCTFVADNDEIKTYCKNENYFCSLGPLMVPVFAQNTGKGLYCPHKALRWGISPNIVVGGDHPSSIPTTKQRKHAVNGFKSKENLNIPGPSSMLNRIRWMMTPSHLVSNGQGHKGNRCSSPWHREDRISWCSSGKLAWCLSSTSSTNNDMEDMQADGLQMIGYDHGDLSANVATNMCKGNNLAACVYSKHSQRGYTETREQWELSARNSDRESYKRILPEPPGITYAVPLSKPSEGKRDIRAVYASSTSTQEMHLGFEGIQTKHLLTTSGRRTVS